MPSANHLEFVELKDLCKAADLPAPQLVPSRFENERIYTSIGDQVFGGKTVLDSLACAQWYAIGYARGRKSKECDSVMHC